MITIKPRYGKGCTSDVPALLLRLFGQGKSLPIFADISKTKNAPVIFFFIDGFGEHVLKLHSEACKLLLSHKKTTLTAVFPSTTPASLNSYCTGTTPLQHGMLDFVMFYPEIDDTVYSLSMESVHDEKVYDDASLLLKHRTIFSRIPAKVYLPSSLVGSIYTKAAYGDAKVIGYKDAFSALRRQIRNLPELHYVYLPEVDYVSHTKDPESPQLTAVIGAIVGKIEKLAKTVPPETLFVICADHGSLRTDKMYLLKGFESYLKTDGLGRMIPPCGGPRCLFLHVQDTLAAKKHFTRVLKGIAKVHLVSDLILKGYFGLGKPSKEFLARAGQLVIIPIGSSAVWYKGLEGYPITFKAYHGGLSPQEMLVPIFAFKAKDFCK